MPPPPAHTQTCGTLHKESPFRHQISRGPQHALGWPRACRRPGPRARTPAGRVPPYGRGARAAHDLVVVLGGALRSADRGIPARRRRRPPRNSPDRARVRADRRAPVRGRRARETVAQRPRAHLARGASRGAVADGDGRPRLRHLRRAVVFQVSSLQIENGRRLRRPSTSRRRMIAVSPGETQDDYRQPRPTPLAPLDEESDAAAAPLSEGGVPASARCAPPYRATPPKLTRASHRRGHLIHPSFGVDRRT